VGIAGGAPGFPLHLPRTPDPEQATATIAREAMRWTYVLRSRLRWVGDSRARERYEDEARKALGEIGLGTGELRELAKAGRVVVQVPWTGDERLHWESRIFPWEYVLSAATRRDRLVGSGQVRPKPLTILRELVPEPPAAPPPKPGRAPFSRGVCLLIVECLPTELRQHWEMEPEYGRLRGALAGLKDAKVRVLTWPTLLELRKAIGEWKPELIHFAGLDSHQGLRELRSHLGAEALVDLGPQQGRSTAGARGVSTGHALPAGLQRVEDVLADSRLMIDGLLLRSDPQERSRAQTAHTGGTGTGDGGGERTYPRLVPAHDLARELRKAKHRAELATFNVWNSAARLAPLLVAERVAGAALGFQDMFDDALAEFVHGLLLEKLRALDWQVAPAFEEMWREVRNLPESVSATGISLWLGQPVPAAVAVAPAQARRGRARAPVEAATEAARLPEGEPVAPALASQSLGATLSVDVKPFEELNYSVLHNAQPLFESFVIETKDPNARPVVDVEVSVHMGTETSRYRRRLQMDARRIALTRDVHVPLTASVARAAREAIGSSIEVEVREGGHTLYRNSHRLRLLPVDQWRDNRRDGRWLPSFVQPRDPAIAVALEQAQRYVRVLRDDPNAGFEGYQLARAGHEDSLRCVDRQVEAIWATLLHDWKLGYINPPPTYSSALDSQRLRLPSAVLRHRAGTCIDLALLFAACLELVDIYPVIFLLEGHALPGWWRHADYREEYFEMPRENFAEIVQPSATENAVANAQVVSWHTGKASWPEVRRWIRQRKLVPIETVRLTEHCGFVEAIEAGIAALSERRDYDSMLDIVTARRENVTPLPVREESV